MGFVRGKGGGKPINPFGPDGNVLLCVACGSFRHLVPNFLGCWENMGVNQVSVVEEKTEKAVLFTSFGIRPKWAVRVVTVQCLIVHIPVQCVEINGLNSIWNHSISRTVLR